ncbi:MAG: hypothetical protein RBR22_02460 [Desulfuromonas sp.]|nr:hypothetical protein [Desulfuromonas sp.]
MKNFRIFLLPITLLLVLSTTSWAIPTQITVRAKAHDAKFIGTAMAGVSVSITDVSSAQVLDRGLILGGTGSTDTLMKQPIKRGQSISNEKTASYNATIDIDEPTQVEIRIQGPQAGGLTAVKSSRTLWVLPGQDIQGDGIVFELYGFVVVPLIPHSNTKYDLGAAVELSTYVTMMCGCPIEPKGLWDADNYQVTAWIWQDGKLINKIPMQAGKSAGVFNASFVPPTAGEYRVAFCASDSQMNNYGVAYSGIAVK